jgi:hypothetical protein
MDLTDKEKRLLDDINAYRMKHEFAFLLIVVVLVLVILILINMFKIRDILQYLFPVAVLIFGYTYLSTVRMLGEREGLIRKLSGYVDRLQSRKQ